jgi:hypothetical protein
MAPLEPPLSEILCEVMIPLFVDDWLQQLFLYSWLRLPEPGNKAMAHNE